MSHWNHPGFLQEEPHSVKEDFSFKPHPPVWSILQRIFPDFPDRDYLPDPRVPVPAGPQPWALGLLFGESCCSQYEVLCHIRQRNLSIASSLAIIASGSDLHSGKRGREPAGTPPSSQRRSQWQSPLGWEPGGTRSQMIQHPLKGPRIQYLTVRSHQMFVGPQSYKPYQFFHFLYIAVYYRFCNTEFRVCVQHSKLFKHITSKK